MQSKLKQINIEKNSLSKSLCTIFFLLMYQQVRESFHGKKIAIKTTVLSLRFLHNLKLHHIWHVWCLLKLHISLHLQYT